MDIAITRDVSRSIERCELTHLAREPIDYDRAAAQHEAYCGGLAAAGLEVVRLPADEAYPDGCFVEDVAVVLDEIAVVTRPGAASRRGETAPVAQELRRFRKKVVTMTGPATVDGGDVLVFRNTLYVGETPRTNPEGIAALRAIVAPFDYDVVPVKVTGCLHLKSAVTAIDDHTLLANRAWYDDAAIPGGDRLDVAPDEPGAANVLRVRGRVWAHPGFPRTFERLAKSGYDPLPMDISEFVKAEAALTCKSLLFRRT